MNVTIRAVYLKSLSLFSANAKDIRYYLRGVYIANGIAAASNGWTAARIQDATIESDGNYILTAETIKSLLASKLPMIEIENSICHAAGVVAQTHDGTFPTEGLNSLFDRSVKAKTEMAHYDPDLLVPFKRAGEALGISKDKCSMRLEQKGYEAPSYVSVGVEGFEGIIMPLRV